MNKYVMQPIDYQYTELKSTSNNIDTLINAYHNNIIVQNNFVRFTNDEYSINVLFRMRGPVLKTLKDIAEQSKNNGLYEFIEPGLNDLKSEGIIGCYDFFCTLLGNADRLPIRKGVGLHIHHDHGTNVDKTCKVFTMIYPLIINNPINEYMTFTWTDKQYPSGSYDLVPTLNFNKKLEKHHEIVKRDACGPTQQIIFPKMDEKLTVKFNGTNWLHGAENFSNNLYLGIVVNDYIKTV